MPTASMTLWPLPRRPRVDGDDGKSALVPDGSDPREPDDRPAAGAASGGGTGFFDAGTHGLYHPAPV